MAEKLQGLGFQSTLPRRERLLLYILWPHGIHFNPRSREGSDIFARNIDKWPIISIHAPAKGATRLKSYSTTVEIFQSTLPRRERQSWVIIFNPSILFQSTLPRRERRWDFAERDAKLVISIHAPAKGATDNTIDTLDLQVNFNPRSREGSDRNQFGRNRICHDFNPRSREGSDSNISQILKLIL